MIALRLHRSLAQCLSLAGLITAVATASPALADEGTPRPVKRPVPPRSSEREPRPAGHAECRGAGCRPGCVPPTPRVVTPRPGNGPATTPDRKGWWTARLPEARTQHHGFWAGEIQGDAPARTHRPSRPHTRLVLTGGRPGPAPAGRELEPGKLPPPKTVVFTGTVGGPEPQGPRIEPYGAASPARLILTGGLPSVRIGLARDGLPRVGGARLLASGGQLATFSLRVPAQLGHAWIDHIQQVRWRDHPCGRRHTARIAFGPDGCGGWHLKLKLDPDCAGRHAVVVWATVYSGVPGRAQQITVFPVVFDSAP